MRRGIKLKPHRAVKRASLGNEGTTTFGPTHNELPVLLLEPLVALSQLVGHQFVLVSLLLTRIQLLGQNEQGLLLALQLALTHQELRKRRRTGAEQEGGGIKRHRRKVFQTRNKVASDRLP